MENGVNYMLLGFRDYDLHERLQLFSMAWRLHVLTVDIFSFTL